MNDLTQQVRRELRILQMEKQYAIEEYNEKHKHFEMHLDMRKKETKQALRSKSFPQILEKCRAFPC